MELIGLIIGILAGVIIVFLICREIVCWYWKINTIVDLLGEQNSLLKSLLEKANVSPDDWICNKCGKNNRKTSLFCTGCGEKK